MPLPARFRYNAQARETIRIAGYSWAWRRVLPLSRLHWNRNRPISKPECGPRYRQRLICRRSRVSRLARKRRLLAVALSVQRDQPEQRAPLGAGVATLCMLTLEQSADRRG